MLLVIMPHEAPFAEPGSPHEAVEKIQLLGFFKNIIL
jgi:hypothetical protein